MSEARQVLRTLYRRVHGHDAAGDEDVLVWAAEQLALLLEGVEAEVEDDATPTVEVEVWVGLNAAQMAQLNDEAQR